jgi:succinate-semialdehyde dehydrogenase/glutarate-semialdehyde dehydrogenase
MTTRNLTVFSEPPLFIDAMVASDARLPFGGTKQSGHGREFSDIGMHEFVNTRTYWSGWAGRR